MLSSINSSNTFDDDSFEDFIDLKIDNMIKKRISNQAKEQFQVKKKRKVKNKLEHKLSIWWLKYIEREDEEDEDDERIFRKRFRITRGSFERICKIITSDSQFFSRFGKPDAIGRIGAPIELLLLGTLRILGRDWTFDDVSESTNISEEVHRVFFHEFCLFGNKILFNEFVKPPRNEIEINDAMKE